MSTTKIGQIFTEPYTKPLIGAFTAGVKYIPGAQYFFYVSGTGYSIQQTVFQDANLTTPFIQPIVADAFGRFPPIYLMPSQQYAMTLLTAVGGFVRQADPVNQVNTYLPQWAVVPTSESRSTTVLTIDPFLQLPVVKNAGYYFEVDLAWASATSGATPGMQYKLDVPLALVATSGYYAIGGWMNNAALTVFGAAMNIHSAQPPMPVGNYGASTLRLAGTFAVTNAANDTFGFYWAQANAGAALFLLGGSSMTLTRMF